MSDDIDWLTYRRRQMVSAIESAGEMSDSPPSSVRTDTNRRASAAVDAFAAEVRRQAQAEIQQEVDRLTVLEHDNAEMWFAAESRASQAEATLAEVRSMVDAPIRGFGYVHAVNDVRRVFERADARQQPKEVTVRSAGPRTERPASTRNENLPS